MRHQPKQNTMNPRKYALIGTSCSGKSTLAYGILHQLKVMGLNADGILQQDRRFGFNRELLETSRIAQYAVISNQINVEAEMMLRPGLDILVSDRSPLDFYAYYEWGYGRKDGLFKMVCEWCKDTFTALIYLNPLPYKEDGQRLPEAQRDEADEFVLDVSRDAKRLYGVPVFLDIRREDVLNWILDREGLRFRETDLCMIPEILQRDVLVGGSYAFNRQTKFSDLDIYVLADSVIPTGDIQYAKDCVKVKDVLGVRAEIRGVTPRIWEYLLRDQKFVEYKYKP